MSGILNTLMGIGGVLQLPSGALASWFADQGATTTSGRSYLQNTQTTTPPSPFINQSPFPVAWTLTTTTKTSSQAGPAGGNTAARYVGTGSWVIRDDTFITFKAMSYTLVMVAQSNSGSSVTAKFGFGFSAPTNVVTIGTTWTRCSTTATLGAGNLNQFNLTNNGADCDITIAYWYIYEGSSDPNASNVSTIDHVGGHLLLGNDAYSKVPTVSGSQVDFSVTNKLANVYFDSIYSLASFTAIACIQKVNTQDNDLVFASATGNTYGDLGLWEEHNKGQSLVFNSGFSDIGLYRQPFSPGVNTLLELNTTNFSVLTWQYDASNTRGMFYVDDVLIAAANVSKSALANFVALTVNPPVQNSAAFKLTSGAFYNRALSRTEIEQASTYLRNKAVADSLTLRSAPTRYIYFEGDSNTDGSSGTAPGGQHYPHLYVATAGAAYFGSIFGMNGNKLSDLTARASLLDAAIPSAKGTRKFILSGMIGTNDGSVTFTDTAANYSTSLLNYWAARKAAGFITVGMGILNRTDANAASGFDTWRKAINTNLRAAVGNQLDAFVDVEADSNIGSATAPNNATYFQSNNVHLTVGTGTTGQAALTVLYKAAVDPLL